MEEFKSAFEQTDNQIEIVIMGAGIDIGARLRIVKFIFEVSKGTTVHMKDWNSGPSEMLPFVNGALNGLINE